MIRMLIEAWHWAPALAGVVAGGFAVYLLGVLLQDRHDRRTISVLGQLEPARDAGDVDARIAAAFEAGFAEGKLFASPSPSGEARGSWGSGPEYPPGVAGGVSNDD